MKILAIETSCDETACAIVEKREGEELMTVLSSVVASSLEKHVKTGGIVPEVAAREQLSYILPVIKQAVSEAGLSEKDVDAIAVTVGPGLIGSLLIGVETAKALALAWDKPIIPVNHVIAHLYANWVRGNEVPEFPVVAMIISGGHTDLLLMKSHEEIEWLGGTRDDAAGECFDKCARVLGLPYPGGPAIAVSAARFETLNTKLETKLPRPLIHEDTLDLSFSGLKTALQRTVDEQLALGKLDVSMMAYEVQEAICDSLVSKLKLAIERYQPKSILIAGGVAANQRLREKINLGVKTFIPSPGLCTDNAVSIGAYALYHPKYRELEKVQADPSLEVV